jgi:RNA ligase
MISVMLKETLDKYSEDGWIISKRHPLFPITIYNYSIKTEYEEHWDDITLQARGLVLDDYGEIVARPFRKFFNLGQGRFVPTDDFEVYEKYDGSLGIVFHYADSWHIATRGSFTSEQSLLGKSFLKQYDLDELDPDKTYLFEIVSRNNRIVVDYGDFENLVLLTSFDKKSGEEIHRKELENIGFKLCEKYDGINDYKALAETIGQNREGYVVRFSNGHRVKIKGAEYLRLHKIITNLSTTAIWETISAGKSVLELLDGFPDEFFNRVKQYEEELLIKHKELKEFYTKTFNEIVEKENRRLFAESAKNYEKPSILFAMLDKKDISQIIWDTIKPEFSKI